MTITALTEGPIHAKAAGVYTFTAMTVSGPVTLDGPRFSRRIHYLWATSKRTVVRTGSDLIAISF